MEWSLWEERTLLSASLWKTLQERFLLPTYHTYHFIQPVTFRHVYLSVKYEQIKQVKKKMKEGVNGKRKSRGRQIEWYRQTDNMSLVRTREQTKNILAFVSKSGFTNWLTVEQKDITYLCFKIRTRPQGWVTLNSHLLSHFPMKLSLSWQLSKNWQYIWLISICKNVNPYMAYWMTGSAGKRASALSSSSTALSFFPVALLRDVLSFFASFLGVFAAYKDSSVQQLYTSTFTWKSGLASSLKGRRREV